MDVKQRIDELRIKHNWTLAKLAKEIGVSDTTVYAWFNEQNFMPSRKTIEDLCEVLGITQAEFYSGIDMDELSAKETILIEAFRKIPADQRDQVIAIVKSFIK